MKSRVVEYWWCLEDDLLTKLAFLVATLHLLSCYLAPHRHSLLSIDRFRDALIEIRIRLLVIPSAKDFYFLAH